MTKTMAQLYHDAQWPQHDYEKADKWRNEREAAGIAAVARHVFDELMAKHLAEHHAKNPLAFDEIPPVRTKPVEPEKIGPNAWAARPWEVSDKPKPVEPEPANGEADWAMDAYAKACCCTSFSRCAKVIREAAERHYGQMVESLDRQMKELEQERDAARAESKPYEAELEKAAARLQRTHKCGAYKAVGLRQVAIVTEQVCDELDAARAECERLKQEKFSLASRIAAMEVRSKSQQESIEIMRKTRDDTRAECERLREALELEKADSRYRNAPPPAAVDGEDVVEVVAKILKENFCTRPLSECRKAAAAIMPSFAAIRRERDEWKSQAAVSEAAMISSGENFRKMMGQRDTLQNKCHELHKEIAEQKQRAAASEAALMELKEAVDDAKARLYRFSDGMYRVDSTSANQHNPLAATPTDAILAAYRASQEPRP